jgi:hypothetical protein
MQIEHKTAFQLEEMIADLTGFNPTAIDVKKLGNAGNFAAAFVGKVAAVSKSRAQADVESACSQLKLRFKLKD